MMSFFYSRFLRTNPPAAITTIANPSTAQTEDPVSARFDDDFSGFLPEGVEIVDVVDEDSEVEEDPADGTVGVVALPVPPGVTG